MVGLEERSAVCEGQDVGLSVPDVDDDAPVPPRGVEGEVQAWREED